MSVIPNPSIVVSTLSPIERTPKAYPRTYVEATIAKESSTSASA